MSSKDQDCARGTEAIICRKWGGIKLYLAFVFPLTVVANSFSYPLTSFNFTSTHSVMSFVFLYSSVHYIHSFCSVYNEILILLLPQQKNLYYKNHNCSRKKKVTYPLQAGSTTEDHNRFSLVGGQGVEILLRRFCEVLRNALGKSLGIEQRFRGWERTCCISLAVL